MSQETGGEYSAPVAEVRSGGGFSIIWIVPIIALLIGGGLAYKAYQEKGQTITIVFPNADGLEAGKTKIKFKDVEIGKVASISLLPDLSGVGVVAEMKKGTGKYLTDQTQFWVVKARVAAGEVSGLGTLFSGAYIGCNPSSDGHPVKEFKGLDRPPVLTEGMPGRHFLLKADNLGSIDVGLPVYYRGIKVGQVVDYDFDTTAESVNIQIFVHAPYHEKVRDNTRFWNSSGLDVKMDASGVEINTESLVSILLGGITFDLKPYSQPGEAAEPMTSFMLYEDKESSREEMYTVKSYYLMFFDQSVRGLMPGAPVEIKGIKIGEVINVQLYYNLETYEFKVPVLVMLEPERMNALIVKGGKMLIGDQMEDTIEDDFKEKLGVMRPQQLVDKGLRAQLKTGNLLTGQLYVDLDFHKDAEPAKLYVEQGYLVFPTIAQSFDMILDRVDNVLAGMEKIDFAGLGEEFSDVAVELKKLLTELSGVSEDIKTKTLPAVNTELLPKIDRTIDELNKTLEGIDQSIGADSALKYNAGRISEELYMTLRSLRSLIDYLERDPQALILGKEGER